MKLNKMLEEVSPLFERLFFSSSSLCCLFTKLFPLLYNFEFFLLQQRLIVERLVKDKSELLEKNHDTQSYYEQQMEVLRNKVSS